MNRYRGTDSIDLFLAILATWKLIEIGIWFFSHFTIGLK